VVFTRALGALLLCALAAVPAVRKPAPRPPSLKTSSAVRRWMSRMSARDEVAQLIYIAFHGESPHTRSREYQRFLRLIRETKIGGLILNNVSNGRTIQKAQPYHVAAFLNKMQRLAGVPLMVGGDFERGASMRLEGVTVFPHAMAFGAAGDPALTRAEGEITAREARAVGGPWN
jgi:beta-N-acetylhexosaminidase